MDRRKVAQIGTFSSIYAISRIVPLFPILGAGTSFPLSDVLVPLYAIIFTPETASLSILLGTFISFALGRPIIFLGLDFLPAVLATFCLSNLYRGKKWPFVITMIGSIILFNFDRFVTPLIRTPIGPIPYQYLHIVILVVSILLPVRVIRNFAYMPVLIFSGTILQHAIGSTMFAYIFGDLLHKIPAEAWPAIWTGSFYLYPFERGFITLASSLITLPLAYAIKKNVKISNLIK